MPAERLRIAFVCDEYPPAPHGGIGTFVRTLGRALVRRGHEVRVIGVRRSVQDQTPDHQDDTGVQVMRLPPGGPGLGWVAARRRLASRLAQWSRRGEIDVIEVADWEGWAAGWPAFDTPVVVRLHGTASYFAAELGTRVRPLVRWLERRGITRADRICATSAYVAERTAELFPGMRTPTVLHNASAVPAPTEFGERQRERVVFAGTLTPKKGVLSLASAWPMVVEQCPWATLDFYGADTVHDRVSTAEVIRVLTAGHASVRVHGRVTHDTVVGALRTARVAALPSYVEAFALAPLEAMACGCPTVVGRRGAAPELGAEGIDLLMVDPDEPRELAKAIVRVLTDDSLAQRLAEQGRHRVADAFDIERAADANLAFYRACVRERKGVHA